MAWSASILGWALAATFWASERRAASAASSRRGNVITGDSIGWISVDRAASTSAFLAAFPVMSCWSFAAAT